VHIISQFDLDILPFTDNPDIGLTQFTKKVQRRSSLLTEGQLKGIVPASLPERFGHVVSYPIEAVRGTKTVYALVGALVVVIADPVIESLACVGKGGKVSILQKLGPYGFPEPLYFAESHGVMGG
jgi:hypothetical protein